MTHIVEEPWDAPMQRNARQVFPSAPDGTGKPFHVVTHVVPADDPPPAEKVHGRATLGSATTSGVGFTIAWQDTLHGDKGCNRRGATVEEVLQACYERLSDFQQLTSFACEANERAMDKVLGAILHLEQRTHDRMRRRVEGKNEA